VTPCRASQFGSSTSVLGITVFVSSLPSEYHRTNTNKLNVSMRTEQHGIIVGKLNGGIIRNGASHSDRIMTSR